MNIFGKKITEIEYNDIEGLVHGKIEESTYLDYKRGISSAAEAKAELARDVSAFANTEGGTLVLGVEERRTKRGGREVFAPGAIHGVSQFRGGQETRLWLEQVMYSATRRPVNTAIQPVNIPGSQSQAFVIYVPKSNHAPHMVWSEGSKHHGRYFKRRNFQNEIAEEYEVRELFERSARLEEKYRQYLGRTAFGLPSQRTPEGFHVSFVCCPSILEDRLINITQTDKLRIDGPTFSWESAYQHNYIIQGATFSPCIWGLTMTEGQKDKPDVRLNIHRNGYIEYVRRFPPGSGVDQTAISQLIGFLKYCTQVLLSFAYYGNVLLFVTISKTVSFRMGRNVHDIVSLYPKDQRIQVADEVFVGDLDKDLHGAVRPLADRFYNLFGLPCASCFDENGQYKAG